jgi:hypothetical protein
MQKQCEDFKLESNLGTMNNFRRKILKDMFELAYTCN